LRRIALRAIGVTVSNEIREFVRKIEMPAIGALEPI
jgi:hypothetical protein